MTSYHNSVIHISAQVETKRCSLYAFAMQDGCATYFPIILSMSPTILFPPQIVRIPLTVDHGLLW